MRRASWVLLVAAVLFLLASVLLTVRAFVEHVRFQISGTVWDALGAVGTVAASVIAIFLAYRSLRQERDAISRLVSAWVSDEFVANPASSTYLRVVMLHISNESNEPVFDAQVSVVVGPDKLALGALSAPLPIAVLPARREWRFDISVPLLARTDAYDIRAELAFSDAKGRKWLRTAEGELREITHEGAGWTERVDPPSPDALGELTPLNALGVAIAFLDALNEGDTVYEDEMRPLLASEADGWKVTDWAKFKQDYGELQATSAVSYPAPYIARVKLVGDRSLDDKIVSGYGAMIEARAIMTLTFVPGRGWRVFGVGQSVAPHAIQFPLGTFDA